MKPENTAGRLPVVYASGGPNGAGKTTFAREFLPAVGVEPFLNADSLAAGLSPLRPEAMAVPAARLLLGRWRALVAARTSFAFESTFSGRTYATMLRDARAAGCSVRVCYLWLPSDSASLRRVRNRVRQGGHNVPPEDIRRRHLPSVRNFFELYLPLSDDPLLYEAASRRDPSPIGSAPPSKCCNQTFMKESDEPLSPQAVDSAMLAELATKAMRRAQRVAEKDAARYGLPLVVNRPRRLPAKAHAKRLRRVKERV